MGISMRSTSYNWKILHFGWNNANNHDFLWFRHESRLVGNFDYYIRN